MRGPGVSTAPEAGRSRGVANRTTHRYVLFLAAAGAVLLGSALLLVRNWQLTTESRQKVARVRQALLDQDSFHSLLVHAESSQRGYLLTGDERYLVPYERTVAQYEERRSAVRGTSPELMPRADLDRMTSVADAKMKELAETVRLQKSGHTEEAIAMVKTHAGQELMDQFETLSDFHREREFQLLLAGNRGVQSRLQTAAALQMFGATTLVIFLALALIDIGAGSREREQQVAEISRMNSEQLQVSSVASHDLKEPLRTIVNYVQLLERRYTHQALEGAGLEYLDVIRTAARRSYHLVDALQRYSSPLSVTAPKVTATDANLALKEVQRSLGSLIAETGTRIFAPTLPLVQIDQGQLEQVFQNLLENAIKYRGTAPPSIQIGALVEGAIVTFSVRDNGVGFDPVFSEKIFDLFQRLHGNEQDGLGLGLATCKKIVERAGGRIWAQSTPGGGSTFCFTVPAGQKPARKLT